MYMCRDVNILWWSRCIIWYMCILVEMLYDNVDEIICAHSRRDYDIMMYISSIFNMMTCNLVEIIWWCISRRDLIWCAHISSRFLWVGDISVLQIYYIIKHEDLQECYNTLCVILQKNRPVTWQTSLLIVRSLRLHKNEAFSRIFINLFLW